MIATDSRDDVDSPMLALMHTDISGQGTTVLFLHGGGVSGWMWQPVLDGLPRGVRTIVPDLPGHGRSQSSEYESHDTTIAELVVLLRENTPRGVLVVGFSLGAQLALRLAAEQPELVRHAILVSGEAKPAPLQGLTLWLLRGAYPLARREWFARLQAKQLSVPECLMNEYLRDSREISRTTLLASVGENIGFRLPGALREFKGETRVVVGEKERLLMRESAQLIHESSRNSRLLVVTGAAHDIPFTRPEVLVEMILAMVDVDR